MKQTKRFILSFLSLMLCTIMYAQTEVTGTVVDETGEGVIGATVMEKGTSNGTVTDFDGNFSLTLKKAKAVVISYIGMVPQEVAASQNMNVTLQDDNASLEEVVVVGYGVSKKGRGK